jgi:hypothetical protein
MPTFTFTVTAAEGVRVMNAFCNNAGVPPTQAATLAILKDYIVSTVKDYEHNLAVINVVDPTPVVPT